MVRLVYCCFSFLLISTHDNLNLSLLEFDPDVY